VFLQLEAQSSVYQIDFKREAIISGSIITLGITDLFTSKGLIPVNQNGILSLEYDDLPGIDQGAIYNWSPGISSASDKLEKFGLLYPLTLLALKPIRKEAGTFMILFGEALSLNTLATTLTKTLAQRTRPFVYNPDVSDEIKFTKDAKKSFFSGHTSNVASMSFLTAKIFSDYFPDSNWRYPVWAFSATLPAVTGYLRVKAGKHFPTDVMIGYTFGALVGYFIPEFHKSAKGPISIQMHSDLNTGGSGLAVVYTF
jgi:membrane-associated phospholipid phosphatase